MLFFFKKNKKFTNIFPYILDLEILKNFNENYKDQNYLE